MLLMTDSVVAFWMDVSLFLTYKTNFSVSAMVLMIRLDTENHFYLKTMWDSLVIATNYVIIMWRM